MKYLLIISLFVSFLFMQQRSTYSWEDGNGTILGSYGNLSSPANVGETSGVSPHDGERMLTVSESPIDGTPQAFIAWVTDLSAGQGKGFLNIGIRWAVSDNLLLEINFNDIRKNTDAEYTNREIKMMYSESF